MLSDDIHQVLRDFHHWDSIGNPLNQLGYPSMDPVRRLLGSTVGSCGLSDDESMLVNAALCALKKEDKQQFQILKLYFWEDIEQKDIAKVVGIHRNTVAAQFKAGKAFIKGFLTKPVMLNEYWLHEQH